MIKNWILSALSIVMMGMATMSCTTVFEEEELEYSRTSQTNTGDEAKYSKPSSSKKNVETDPITEVYPMLSVVVTTDSNNFWDGSTIVTITKVKIFDGETSMEFGLEELSTELAEPCYKCSFNCLPQGVTMEKKQLLKDGILPFALQVGKMPSLNYTIWYVVRTKDERLGDGWTECMNREDGVFTFPYPISHDFQYDLLLNVNLSCIQFDSEVTNWG